MLYWSLAVDGWLILITCAVKSCDNSGIKAKKNAYILISCVIFYDKSNVLNCHDKNTLGQGNYIVRFIPLWNCKSNKDSKIL